VGLQKNPLNQGKKNNIKDQGGQLWIVGERLGEEKKVLSGLKVKATRKKMGIRDRSYRVGPGGL